jgi:phage shock protein C
MIFKRKPTRRTLYRSRSGMILGVCKGLAEHFGVSLKWTRVIAVLVLIFTGFWPAAAIYLAAAYFMTPEPLLELETELEEEFYNSYSASRSMALGRLKSQFDRLDRRIQRMEDVVTDREYSWEQRLNS